jgi:predicted amidophosphoribosyltransferase
MIKCNNCGNEIKKEYKFCPFCGLRLSLKIKCSYCNSENDRGAKYCHECGNELPHTKPPQRQNLKLAM